LKVYKIASKLYVVPNGYSEAFYILPDKRENKIPFGIHSYFIFIGNRTHYKNFDFFIKAYSEWHLNQDIGIILVGNTLSDSEVKLLKQLGILNRIVLLSNLSDEELCHLYNNSLALIYPSLYEGFGIPLLEAMACGCAIIASRIPSTIEVAKDFPIYFEPEDLDSILSAFDKVIRVHNNPAYKEKGLKIVKQYSWNNTARQTLEVYYQSS
jgi:glycosyltransferase involved in cell wall biosynthesis